MASTMDDRECVGRYLAGDVSAMEVLVHRHENALFGFIRGLVQDASEADDVFQETWTKAIRHLHKYRSDNFRGWLIRIAHNVFIDRLRRRKPFLSMDTAAPDNQPLMASLPSPAPGPDSETDSAELGARIALAVAALPREQREVFLMRAHGGLAFREIARLQSTSINTALSRMQYALKKLRQELKDDYTELAGKAASAAGSMEESGDEL